MRKQIELFHSRYIKSEAGCWEWTWKKDKDGYGQFHARPYHQAAHRFSFHLFHKINPHGLCVCHSCDNPSCVNPDHLWLGTVTDNNRDAWKKGRKVSPNKDKAHCKRGHPFTEANTYIQSTGSRICRICRRMKVKEWKQKHKGKLK